MVSVSAQLTYKFVDRKVIIRLKDRICETPEEMLYSELYLDILHRFVRGLVHNASPLLVIFQKEPGEDIDQDDIDELAQAFILETNPSNRTCKRRSPCKRSSRGSQES